MPEVCQYKAHALLTNSSDKLESLFIGHYKGLTHLSKSQIAYNCEEIRILLRCANRVANAGNGMTSIVNFVKESYNINLEF